jgi:hypothetical protein
MKTQLLRRRANVATFELKLTVEYDLNGENPNTMRCQLERAVDFLVGEGLLTGYSDATVERWESEVLELCGAGCDSCGIHDAEPGTKRCRDCHCDDCDKLYGGDCTCDD